MKNEITAQNPCSSKLLQSGYGPKDASSQKTGDFQRSGKKVADRVIHWGSAAEAVGSVDHLHSPSLLPLPLPGKEQPLHLSPWAGTASGRGWGGESLVADT